MKTRKVVVLKEVANDLKSGKLFYEAKKVFGLYRMLAKRFSYAIYYQIKNDTVHVVAILPIRRDPKWIKNQLRGRI